MNKKKLIISIAIAIIFALFVGYGIEVFDPSQKMEDFCKDNLYEITDEEQCLSEGGVWNEGAIPKPVIEEVEGRGICTPGRECYDAFENSSTRHDMIVFIVGVVLGLAAVITGILLKRDAISTGILSGGVLVILYGTLRYWRHADDTLKFVLLGVTLTVLVWIAYKKLDRK